MCACAYSMRFPHTRVMDDVNDESCFFYFVVEYEHIHGQDTARAVRSLILVTR